MSRIRFDAKKRCEEALVKESFGKWVSIMTSRQIEVPYLVSRSNLRLQDKLYDLENLTENETKKIFEVKSVGWRAYEHNPQTLMVITQEADLDLKRIERS